MVIREKNSCFLVRDISAIEIGTGRTFPVLPVPFFLYLCESESEQFKAFEYRSSLQVSKLFFSSFGREPCPRFGWVPPAGSFLSRQEAPQECGLRSIEVFAHANTAILLKNSSGPLLRWNCKVSVSGLRNKREIRDIADQ